MHLIDLVPGPVAAHSVAAHPDAGSIGTINVTGISSDSRAVAPGHLFVALKGSSGDGRTYATAAVEAGAVAILTDERELDSSMAKLAKGGVPILTCSAPRLELAYAAARFWPRQPGMIAAVTGTNGK
ncbi:MAG: Mur ligase domain-containing protein, partial [Alphaproteobacteria bacterium]